MPGAVRWLWLERQDCLTEGSTEGLGVEVSRARGAWEDSPSPGEAPAPEWREVTAGLWGTGSQKSDA